MKLKFVALAVVAAMSGAAHAQPSAGTTDLGTVTTDGKSANFASPAKTTYDHFFSFVLDNSYFLSETAVANNNTRSIFINNYADLEKFVGGEWTYIGEFEFTNVSTTKEFGLQGPGHYRTEVTADSVGTSNAYGTIQVLIDPPITPVVVPVPEPETYALMLAGLGAIGFVARRRKSA